jgi:hypothetical protein
MVMTTPDNKPMKEVCRAITAPQTGTVDICTTRDNADCVGTDGMCFLVDAPQQQGWCQWDNQPSTDAGATAAAGTIPTANPCTMASTDALCVATAECSW